MTKIFHNQNLGQFLAETSRAKLYEPESASFDEILTIYLKLGRRKQSQFLKGYFAYMLSVDPKFSQARFVSFMESSPRVPRYITKVEKYYHPVKKQWLYRRFRVSLPSNLSEK